MKKNIIFVVVLLVVGGGAFFGGMKYADQARSTAVGNFRNARNGVPGSQFSGRMGGGTSGDVIAKDATSVTLKLRNGGSKIVFYGATTEFSKFVAGSANDLVIGQTVVVNGTANSDGSVTAQTIQIRPAAPPVAPATTPAP